MIEVTHVLCIEADLPLPFPCHAYANLGAVDLLDGGQITIRYSELAQRRGELDTIALREVSADLLIGRDALQPFRIVSDLAPCLIDGDSILLRIDGDDGGVGSFANLQFPAAFRVVENIANVVLLGPLTIGARELRAGNERL